MDRATLARHVRLAARSQIHDERGLQPGGIAIYTLADPRDAREARYVGQTRDPRRRFSQHLHTARLWLPDEVPWWIRAPRHRPLYEWLRDLYRDGGRLPFMWVCEWVDGDADALAAERAAIMRLVGQGASLLNFEAQKLGSQLVLL